MFWFTAHTWQAHHSPPRYPWMIDTRMTGLTPSVPCGSTRPRPRMGGVFPLRAYIQCGTLPKWCEKRAPFVHAAPPRLWHDLLAYHAIGVNITNPVGNSTMDILDVFSEFDDISFPCTTTDPTYGGMGSNFSILERAMAFDHALRSDALPGSSNHDTMDCPCVTNSGAAGRPCSMSLPGFMPHV